MQVIDEVDRVQDAIERSGDMGDDRPHRDGKEHLVMSDEPKALDDLLPDGRRGRPGGPRRLRRPDEEERDRRHGERQRIDQDREGGADQLDECAREPRATDLRERRARGELAVPVDHAVDADERGNVGRVRRIEERAEGPSTNVDDIELLHPQDAGAYAIGIEAGAATGPRPSRSGSACAEAGRPRRPRGIRPEGSARLPATTSSAISVGPAPRTSSASRGTAVRVTTEPSSDTVWPVHSFRKSVCRQSDGGVVVSRSVTPPA